jgi:AcrR family transcriptional regulator
MRQTTLRQGCQGATGARRHRRQGREVRVASRGQGERAGLSRGLVLDAAVALVDSDGLDGLSMRRLGSALGVEAMTLYHYLPNKAALLDGLVEWVMQHTATAPARTDGLPWDQVLRGYAQTLRATLLGHPGVLPLFFTRPAVTPQTLRTVEHGLRVLTDAGFALPRALDMINVLSIFVVGHAMAEAGTAELTRRGDPGSAAALARLDASDLPLVIEAARLAQGRDDETRFLFGLDALLDGFARWQEPHTAAK